jgi:hypothetical protein
VGELYGLAGAQEVMNHELPAVVLFPISAPLARRRGSHRS